MNQESKLEQHQLCTFELVLSNYEPLWKYNTAYCGPVVPYGFGNCWTWQLMDKAMVGNYNMDQVALEVTMDQ